MVIARSLWVAAMAALAISLLLAVLASGGLTQVAFAAGSAQTGPPEPKEIGGLRATPNRPVASVVLRPGQRDHHPMGAAARRAKCDKTIDIGGFVFGVQPVAAQDNGICTSADIDVYQPAGASYVVQAGGEEAAWTHTDVSNPASPVIAGQFKWSGRGGKGTYTPDVKAFGQGSDRYIVMGLERLTVAGYCGVVIVNVTNPAATQVTSQFIGSDWCDTHNVFVENDASGDGKFIYATADATHDMRVLAIGGSYGGQTASVTNPVEIGRYRSPTANTDNYVHDVTVATHPGLGRRAYLAYWDTGTVVLDAAGVTPGATPTLFVGPNQIDPPGFLSHHAYPNAAGTYVFIEDEMTYSLGFEPVQMWTIAGSGSTKRDGLGAGVGLNGERLPAHNLHVEGNTLYVGWYKAGLQAFSFDDDGVGTDGFGARTVYHQVQTSNRDDPYDGAWGVRVMPITSGTTTATYVFQSDRRYGLIIDRLLGP